MGTGEWMRGVDLLKEVVEAGFPVDVVKHARLLSDMKQTYAGDEPLDISPQVGGPLAERGTHDLMLERELSWMASVPNVQRFQQHKATLADKVGDIDRVPLHALTAAISPHWLDGSPSTLSTMDRCRQLLDAPEDEESQSVDAAATHEPLGFPKLTTLACPVFVFLCIVDTTLSAAARTMRSHNPWALLAHVFLEDQWERHANLGATTPLGGVRPLICHTPFELSNCKPFLFI